jgi:sec-independent protein translocase protein TatC
MSEIPTEQKEMSFLDHLEILRWHLIRSLVAIMVFAVLAFIFNRIIFDVIILGPKSPDFFTNKLLCGLGAKLNMPSLCINNIPFNVINIRMAGQFSTHMMISLMSGLIVGFPYLIWELWRFVKPALYEQERKSSNGAVFFVSVLFLTGILFGYYMIAPLSVHFLGSYSVSSQIVNQIDISSYISTVASIVFASGLVFELPVLILFLTKAGLITPQFLIRYRSHSIVVIFIIAAIITPPDAFSQILVAIPLLGLYEGSIFLSKRVVKKQAMLANKS